MWGPLNRRPDLGCREKELARVIQEWTKAPAGVEGDDIQVERVDEKHLDSCPFHDFVCQTHCLGKQVRAQSLPLVAQVHGQPSQAHRRDGIALTESGDIKTLGFDLGDGETQVSRELALGSGGQERPGRVATLGLASLLAEPLIERMLPAIELRSVHSAIPWSERPWVRVTCADPRMHHVANGLRLTTPLRTVIDIAPMVDGDQLEIMVQDCLERGLFTIEEAWARIAEPDMLVDPGAIALVHLLSEWD